MGSSRVRSASPSEIGQPLTPIKKESSHLKQASLTIVKGANQGAEFPLTSDRARIGREKIDNEITLDDTQVSRNHAVITFENRQYTIEDLRSTNGTKVNGQPVTRHTLTDGDVIQIGDTFLAFYL
jgi:pSer/pThr/pTyr-binding forkhead associated (FHA) protein